MTIRKIGFAACACLATSIAAIGAQDVRPRDGLLFRASFDSFNTAADKAANAAASGEGIA